MPAASISSTTPIQYSLNLSNEFINYCLLQRQDQTDASSTNAKANSLTSPTLSDSGSNSTLRDSLSASSSPLSYMNGHHYSIVADPNVVEASNSPLSMGLAPSSDLFMYSMPSNEFNSASSVGVISPSLAFPESRNSILPSQIPMEDFMPIDYSLHQQHPHHISISSMPETQTPSHPVSSDPTIANSSIENMPPAMGYVSFNQSQQLPQLDSLRVNAAPIGSAPRFSFNIPSMSLPETGAIKPYEFTNESKPRTANDNLEKSLGQNFWIKVEQDEKQRQLGLESSINTRQLETTDSVWLSNQDMSDNNPAKRKRLARRRLTRNQKIAHNKIEKKYRTNINEKIFGLQDLISPSWNGQEGEDLIDEDGKRKSVSSIISKCNDEEESSGEGEYQDKKLGTSYSRPNKSSILERAAEYIKYLKTSNSQLKQQNAELKAQLMGKK